jgi:transcriptional regulator with XRE-family HTH domain
MKKKRKEQLERLGNKIREARMKKDWTQLRLASAIDLDIRTVQRIERGESNITFGTIMALAEALGINVSEINQVIDTGKKHKLLMDFNSEKGYVQNVSLPNLSIGVNNSLKFDFEDSTGVDYFKVKVTFMSGDKKHSITTAGIPNCSYSIRIGEKLEGFTKQAIDADKMRVEISPADIRFRVTLEE